MLSAKVTLQADILDVQPLHRVEEILRREQAVLLMLKLRVALPAQADAQLAATLNLGPLHVGRPVNVLVLPVKRQAGGHAGHPEVMHNAKGSLVLDDHVHALDLPHGQRQRPRAGHDHLIAEPLQLAGEPCAVDLVAEASLQVQESRAHLLAVPDRRRHAGLLVAEDLLNPAALQEHHAVFQVALAQDVPATVKGGAVVLRLLDGQLVGDLLALGEVAHDPGGKLHVQGVDRLVRRLLAAPEAGLHELVVHVLQNILGVVVVPLSELGCHRVQARHLPNFLVALLGCRLVQMVQVVVKVGQAQELVDAIQLRLRIGDQVFVLNKEEAVRVCRVARQEHLIGLLQVIDQVAVAEKVFQIVGPRNPDEGCRAVLNIADGGDDLGLAAQKIVEHGHRRCLGPIPRLVDHDGLLDVGVLRLHDPAQDALDLLAVGGCLLGHAPLPRLERVEHHLAHAAGGAGVDVWVLVQQGGQNRAAGAG